MRRNSQMERFSGEVLRKGASILLECGDGPGVHRSVLGPQWGSCPLGFLWPRHHIVMVDEVMGHR